MTLEELLSILSNRGAVLFHDGGNLVCRAPKGTLTPELRQALVKNKPAIIHRLISKPPPDLPWECRCHKWEGEVMPHLCVSCENTGICFICGGCRSCWLDRLFGRLKEKPRG